MGVVNVTPDSFSDAGRATDPLTVADRALGLVADGADILDLGGESTRPGAAPVGTDEELDRVLPAIAEIRLRTDTPLSIDTRKADVAAEAVKLGAFLWNDVSALTGEDSLSTAAALGCFVVLMHMQGDPKTMQLRPRYVDVVDEVIAYLAQRAEAALAAGVDRERIILDPGVGFGKTRDHNLALIANLDRLRSVGFPVLLGASRKQFIQTVDGTGATATERLGGSVAAALAGARAGCALVRVHDVRETTQALRLQWALSRARTEP
jgi:dihydropteroate synthase